MRPLPRWGCSRRPQPPTPTPKTHDDPRGRHALRALCRPAGRQARGLQVRRAKRGYVHGPRDAPGIQSRRRVCRGSISTAPARLRPSYSSRPTSQQQSAGPCPEAPTCTAETARRPGGFRHIKNSHAVDYQQIANKLHYGWADIMNWSIKEALRAPSVAMYRVSDEHPHVPRADHLEVQRHAGCGVRLGGCDLERLPQHHQPLSGELPPAVGRSPLPRRLIGLIMRRGDDRPRGGNHIREIVGIRRALFMDRRSCRRHSPVPIR